MARPDVTIRSPGDFGQRVGCAMPAVVTHNYHPDAPFLANLCDLGDTEAEAVLDRVRSAGHRSIGAGYLRRRRETEAWLVREKRRLLGPTALARPVYLFLGDFDDGLDLSRPSSLVMPLDAFPAGTLTFTYPDSMASLPLGREARPAPYHGRVFTSSEIRQIVADFGLPDRRPRLGGSSHGFIEVQAWDDAPIRGYMATTR